jgi:hypothetical protein
MDTGTVTTMKTSHRKWGARGTAEVRRNKSIENSSNETGKD